MKTICFCNATATINYHPVEYPARPGDVAVTFINHHTNVSETRVYKTLPAAKAAITRFFNRVNNIYG